MNEINHLAASRFKKNLIKSMDAYFFYPQLTTVDKQKIGFMIDRELSMLVNVPVVEKKVVTRIVEVPVSEMIEKRVVSPEEVIEFVREQTGVGDFLVNTMRTRPLVYARQLCMFIMKNHSNLSLKAIGKYFTGNWGMDRMHHTTIIHNVRQGLNLIEQDDQYYNIYMRFLKKYTNDGINDGADSDRIGTNADVSRIAV